MGFRSFEIDVHDHKNGVISGCKSLYITHGNTKVNNWDLKKAMEVLNKYGFLFS
jgi:hypothetical protein